jgi:rubrerythrin
MAGSERYQSLEKYRGPRKYQGPITELTITEFRPMIAKTWHPTKNGRNTADKAIAISQQPAWWLCNRCGMEWIEKIHTRLSADGVGHEGCLKPLPAALPMPAAKKPDTARGRRPVLLVDGEPGIAAMWHAESNHPAELASIAISDRGSYWWVCPSCQTPWLASLPRMRKGRTHQCEESTNEAREAERSADTKPSGRRAGLLIDGAPAVAAQWHPEKNLPFVVSKIVMSSQSSYWWTCPSCGAPWFSTVRSMRSGRAHRCKAPAGEPTSTPPARSLYT